MSDFIQHYNSMQAQYAADAASPVVLPAVNLHEDWPFGAEYRAEYRLRAWPTDATNHVAYFASFKELTDWYNSQLRWVELEDNDFWLDKLEHWDLGPQIIPNPF